MTNLTHKSLKQFLGPAMRVVTLALFLMVFGAGAALAQTRAYVVNVSDGTVSVIDVPSNTLVATVPVGIAPRAVAVTPNGAFAYVANSSGALVSVINTATNTVVATVPVGFFSQGIAVTPNGAFVYVANVAVSTISVINTATNTVSTTIPGLQNPAAVAITPNGNFAYVAGFTSSVRVIDTASNTIVARETGPSKSLLE